MKKIFGLLLMLCVCFTSIMADDIPFRHQRRELFKLLPINEESIVFVGNSITNFNVWNEVFGSDLRVVNRGISGITSGEWLSHIDLIISGKPAKIFIMLGVNDFATPDVTVPNISRMIDVIREESPQTEIYIQSILPANRDDRGSLIEPWNEGLQQLCQEKNVPYIDLWSKMIVSTTDHGLNAEYTTDNLHMNGSGYRVWTNDYEQYTGIASSYFTTGGNQYISSFNAVENMLLSNYCLLPVEDGDILMLGDYNVETGEWMELLRNPKVKNRGMGIGIGYSLTLQNLNQAVPYLVKSNVGKVFVSCGAKDLYNNVTPSTAANYYQQVLNSIRSAAPNAEIYVQSIVPDASASVNNSKMIPFNNAIKALVEQDASGKMHFIDVYAQLAENGALANKYVGANTTQSKGINGRGYLRWANTIAPFVDASIEPLPEPTDAEMEMIEQLATARYLYRNIEIGEEIGQYSATVVDKLVSAINAADTFFKNGNYTEASLVQETQKLVAVCTEVEESRVGSPLFSTDDDEFWYTLSTPLRNNYQVQSTGVGQGLIGAAATTNENQLWKFVKRDDNSIDIINCADNSYIDPASASTNSQLRTSAGQPTSGWRLSFADSNDCFIITSGTVQLNQTTSTYSYKIYNWGSGVELIDAGCQFKISRVEYEATPTPEVSPVYTAVNLVMNGSAPIRVDDEFAQTILSADAISVVVDFTPNTVSDHMAFAAASNTNGTEFVSYIINNSSALGFGVRWGDAGECLTNSGISTNTRQKVVFSLSKTKATPYLNGVQKTEVTESSAPWTIVPSEVNNVNALYIGGFVVSNNTNKYPFSGTIHSIRFYAKALTASEVANLTYDNLIPTSTESYAVTFGTAENGTFEIRKGNDIISSGTEVLNGTNLTVVATPTDGYELDAITVNGTEISGNSFTVTGPTEIEVTFKEASATVEYCTPGYDSASNDPTLFLTAITSNGAKNELNYTASTVPNSPIVLLENGITVEQGTSFTITFTGNLSNVGSAVGNQFRYKHAEIFADWNGDGEFNGSTFGADEWIAKIGDCAPNPSSGWDNGTAVNTIAQTFTVPMDANAGSSRIRIKYVDAWHVRQGNDVNSDGPCVKLNKGILYDIPVTIESISTSIDAVERNPLLVKVINRTIKCSLPFTLFSIHGYKISPESQLPSGIYIVKTEIGTRKVVVY